MLSNNAWNIKLIWTIYFWRMNTLCLFTGMLHVVWKPLSLLVNGFHLKVLMQITSFTIKLLNFHLARVHTETRCPSFSIGCTPSRFVRPVHLHPFSSYRSIHRQRARCSSLVLQLTISILQPICTVGILQSMNALISSRLLCIKCVFGVVCQIALSGLILDLFAWFTSMNMLIRGLLERGSNVEKTMW